MASSGVLQTSITSCLTAGQTTVRVSPLRLGVGGLRMRLGMKSQGVHAMSVQAIREAVAQQVGAVEVAPMAIHIGAEIRGVDLSRPLPPEHVSAIRSALLRWKVVFFRDQSLDHASHIAAARHFGETTAGHVVYGSDGE